VLGEIDCRKRPAKETYMYTITSGIDRDSQVRCKRASRVRGEIVDTKRPAKEAYVYIQKDPITSGIDCYTVMCTVKGPPVLREKSLAKRDLQKRPVCTDKETR